QAYFLSEVGVGAVNDTSLIHGASTSSAGGHSVAMLGHELTLEEPMSEGTDSAALSQSATLAQRENEFRALIDVGLGANKVGEVVAAGGGGDVAGQHLGDEEGMVQIPWYDDPLDEQ
ncbi:hypothetical protein Dimus_024654, partial [Dionaea muscipula]